MLAGELCTRDVVFGSPTLSVREAALLMRQRHVGTVVVCEDRPAGRYPVGMVTDRDIVLAVVAVGVDAERLTVRDIMSADVTTVDEHEPVFDALQRMRESGVRRAPVINTRGALVGILSVDDLLGFLGDQTAELLKLLRHGQAREERTRK
jgi:CBS domain-containing protein